MAKTGTSQRHISFADVRLGDIVIHYHGDALLPRAPSYDDVDKDDCYGHAVGIIIEKKEYTNRVGLLLQRIILLCRNSIRRSRMCSTNLKDFMRIISRMEDAVD